MLCHPSVPQEDIGEILASACAVPSSPANSAKVEERRSISESSDQKPPESAASRAFFQARTNPYAHFLLSELQAGVTGLTVYALCHFFSYLIERFSVWLPLENPEPLGYLAELLAWGSVFGGGGSFIILTGFGFVNLMSRLWKSI